MKKTIFIPIVIIIALGLLVLGYGYVNAAKNRNFGQTANNVLSNSIQLPNVQENSNFASMLEPWQKAQKDYTTVNQVISRNTPVSEQKLVDQINNFYTVELKDGENELKTLILIQNFKKDASIAPTNSATEGEKAISDTMTRIKNDMDEAEAKASFAPAYQEDADKLKSAVEEYYNDLNRGLQDVKAGKSTNISQDKLYNAIDTLVKKMADSLQQKVNTQKSLINKTEELKNHKFSF